MIAIILVNWNGWQDTIACIRSCLALTDVEARIIVCDNASSDDSVEKILEWARGDEQHDWDVDSPVDLSNGRLPHGVAVLSRAEAEDGADGEGAELLIVETGANLGFAGGNNVGLRWAMAQDVTHAWLLNNDTVVPPDALRKLVDFMADSPSVGLCGSAMVEYERPDQLQGYAGALDLSTFRGRHLGADLPAARVDAAMALDPVRDTEVLYPIGASMLASSAFLQHIGLMEEAYFLYYEEADWVLRARGKFDVAIAPRSIVYHKVGASAGKVANGMSRNAAGFLYRSRLLAARRFHRNRMAPIYLDLLLEFSKALVRGRRNQAKGLIDAMLQKVDIPHLK